MINQLKRLVKKDIIIISLLCIAILILNIPLMFYIKKIGYQSSKETMNLELRRVSEKIEGNIFSPVQSSLHSLSEKEYLTELLDEEGEITAQDTTEKVNLLLRNTKDLLDLNTVYLMNSNGDVIAGTTHGNTKETFVGNNYSFRPYFQEAMAGNDYVYGAVGKVSQERGFYFSKPVRKDGRILGVLVIKIDLKKIDRILQEFDNKVILLAPEDVVFASNSSEFLYKSFTRKKAETISRVELKEQFGIEESVPLQRDFSKDKVKIREQNYLYKESALNITGWSLVIFNPVRSFFYSSGNRELFFIICSVILLLGFIIILLLINHFYRKKLEKKLRKFSKAVEQSPVSVIITDLEGTIEYVNQQFERVTGYQTQEVIGKRPSILKSGMHSDKFYQELWNTINNGDTWEGEFYNKKRDGEYYWEDAKITPLIDSGENIEAFIGIKEDITKEKQMKEKLEFFAERDELTNIYNRRVGTQLIKEKKREVDDEGGNFSLAFIDINNLKLVNDVYGHDLGDELIVTVVNKIRENIRSSDILARFGGDEFIIIFAEAREEDAVRKLEFIQGKFKEMNDRKEYNYKISISYGVEEYYQDKEMNVDELISAADSKMYKFKEEYKEEHELPMR
ncbi:MAG: diguanylate cyclase [Halanaerobacter sp.]